MARTVILRHVLPDATWHHDWLIEPDTDGNADDNARTLIAFRLSPRTSPDAGGPLLAERMPDHRRLYLHFEGAIGEGRGTVARVARGQALVTHLDRGALHVSVRWETPAPDAPAWAQTDASWQALPIAPAPLWRLTRLPRDGR